MNNNIIEQPELELDNSNSKQINDVIDNQEIQEGSIYGKFKNANNLLEAYNSLQAEFTRKSQKLAEFQKEYEENANFKKYNSIDDFIKSTNDSDKYKKEITEILVNDNELNNLPNKYQIAFKIIKQAENKLADNLNNQQFIDEFIVNNESVKSKIINNYLSTLNNISSSPQVISGNSTNIHFSPNTNNPRTIKEAGEIFSKMLK